MCSLAASTIPSSERRTGASNSGRYSNPELDALTARAAATIDDRQREGMLREAVKMAMDDVAVIPLLQLVNSWALRKGLTYDARMDERTTAMAVRAAARAARAAVSSPASRTS